MNKSKLLYLHEIVVLFDFSLNVNLIIPNMICVFDSNPRLCYLSDLKILQSFYFEVNSFLFLSSKMPNVNDRITNGGLFFLFAGACLSSRQRGKTILII